MLPTGQVRVVEWQGGSNAEDEGLLEGLCLHPNDPPKIHQVIGPCVRRRILWAKEMRASGLRIAVAFLPGGEKAGLVECVPLEHSAEPVSGPGGLFINCLWVLPEHRGKGVATALLEHVKSWTQETGVLAVLAYERDKWFGYFSYMPAGFFRRFGFAEVDQDGSRVLMLLNTRSQLGAAVTAASYSIIRPRTHLTPKSAEGKSVVEILVSSQCPWAAWMVHRAKEHLKSLAVEVRLVNTDDPSTAREYGLTRGVFIDGKPLLTRLSSGPEIARAVRASLSST